MENAHQAKGSKGKGQYHAHDRHREGLLPDSHELIQLTFQSREEQQGIEAKGGHRLKRPETLVV